MSRAVPKERKNQETNSEPLSEVTCEGTPCLENTWITKSLANSGAEIVSNVGMKIDCFVIRSTTTRIAVWVEDGGRCSMKSMEMEFHGFSGMGSCCSVPYSLWR